MNETRKRVPRLDPAQAQTAARACGVPEQLAGLSVFRVLLHHPPVARQLAAMLQTLLLAEPKLDARLRELVIMRIGWRTGSVYEWTQHWRVARGIGVSEADLLAVRDWRSAKDLSAADRAVLQATDDTLDHGMIGDAAWAACCRALPSPEEQIELVVALGNWTLFSQLLRSLRVPLEEGVTPWPPDGVSPEHRPIRGGRRR